MNSVFISSTFRDMHFERDVLNNTVNARLNRRLSEYNQSVRLLDLRWGVDTSELSEEEATARVLRVCFDGIDSCQPYMIILLGDRYGYIPDNSGLSVTHMEILRGAIRSANPEHVFIYLRETDYSGMPEDMYRVYREQDSAAISRLDALKAELLQAMPQRCRKYRSRWSDERRLLVSDEFEAMVYADLEADLLEELSLKQYRSELHKQLSENDEILQDRLQYAYCDQQELAARLEQIQKADMPCGIIGQAGAGKSVYMSLLCSALRDAGHPAYILFCGDNAFSASVRNAAEAVLYCMTVCSDADYDFEQNALLSYDELLQRLLSQRQQVKRRVYILLDAVDKCEDGMINFLLWCRRFLSEGITMVFSSQQTQQITQAEQSFLLSSMTYDRQGLQAMTHSLLRRYGKAINDTLIEQISAKATTPLQLHVLLLRLLNLSSKDFAAIEQQGGGMTAINGYLQGLIAEASSDEGQLLEDYLRSLQEGSANPDFDLILLSLLTFTDRGLQETDLHALIANTTLQWVQLDYMEFLARYAFLIRVRESGRLDISHDVIRRSFRKMLAGEQRMLCILLADYFFHAEQPDEHTISSFFSAVYMAKQPRRLVDYLLMHKDTLSAMDTQKGLQGRYIRKAFSQLLLNDDGRFFLLTMSSCSDLEETVSLQSAITTSLLRINDYLTDEAALRVTQLCMMIPTQSGIFPADWALLELRGCEKFLLRHKIDDQKIAAFLEQHRQSIGKHAKSAPQQVPNTGDPIDQLLEKLYDDSADLIPRTMAMEKLCTLGRQMARSAKDADRANTLLRKLLDWIEGNPLDMDEHMLAVMYADIYTSLGQLCKSTKQWEAGIEWDEKSAEIYRQLYEKSRTPDIFRKYRERVYNVANVVEAWALHEKKNAALWERTRQCYARVYELETQAVAHGLPDLELLHCASAILSYGTAIINTGDHEGGLQKYREGMELVMELTANHPRPDLYLDLCLHQLECAYQLCLCGQFSAAQALCADIGYCVSAVLTHGQEKHRNDLWHYVASFSHRINDFQTQLARIPDFENILVLYRISDALYTALLSLNNRDVNANLMVVKRNIGNFLLRNKEYEEAFETYKCLMELVKERDLAAADAKGRYDEQANVFLASVYARSLMCLEQLGRQEMLKTMLDSAPEWAGYVAQHTHKYQDDPARILYMMGGDLAKLGSHLAIVFIMMSFNETQKEGYDIEKNKETVAIILQTLARLKGNGSQN